MTDERIATLMGWPKPHAGGYSCGPADMLQRLKTVIAEAQSEVRVECAETCRVLAATTSVDAAMAQQFIDAIMKRPASI